MDKKEEGKSYQCGNCLKFYKNKHYAELHAGKVHGFGPSTHLHQKYVDRNREYRLRTARKRQKLLTYDDQQEKLANAEKHVFDQHQLLADAKKKLADAERNVLDLQKKSYDAEKVLQKEKRLRSIVQRQREHSYNLVIEKNKLAQTNQLLGIGLTTSTKQAADLQAEMERQLVAAKKQSIDDKKFQNKQNKTIQLLQYETDRKSLEIANISQKSFTANKFNEQLLSNLHEKDHEIEKLKKVDIVSETRIKPQNCLVFDTNAIYSYPEYFEECCALDSNKYAIRLCYVVGLEMEKHKNSKNVTAFLSWKATTLIDKLNKQYEKHLITQNALNQPITITNIDAYEFNEMTGEKERVHDCDTEIRKYAQSLLHAFKNVTLISNDKSSNNLSSGIRGLCVIKASELTVEILKGKKELQPMELRDNFKAEYASWQCRRQRQNRHQTSYFQQQQNRKYDPYARQQRIRQPPQLQQHTPTVQDPQFEYQNQNPFPQQREYHHSIQSEAFIK